MQIKECENFVDSRAVIICQADYELTRLVDKRLGDLNATSNDKVDATEIAHGFGIVDSDITYISQLPVFELGKAFVAALKPLRVLA